MLVSILAAGAASADYGFDSYGEYFWADGDETFGPVYSWIDASGGTDIGASDKYTWIVQLPFDVMFYGRLFAAGSDFRVTTNTDCGFGYAGMGVYNDGDRSDLADPDGAICLSWDVIFDPLNDHLYVYETVYSGENAWVISYEPRGRYARSEESRLQTIVLETDGTHDSTIIYQYEGAVFDRSVFDYDGASAAADIESVDLAGRNGNGSNRDDRDSDEGVVVWYLDSDLLNSGAFNPARP